MPINETAKNAMLKTAPLGNLITHLSLHTAYPATPANEVAGGSYARKAVTWGTASGGEITATGPIVFDVPASTTIAGVGYFNALTSGTQYGDFDIVDEVYSANGGAYTLTEAKINLNK